MKTTLLWSLTALCGVVGGWVAHYGGWSRFNPSLPTIRITKVVYVTNEVTLDQGRVVNGWDEPLKPLDEPMIMSNGEAYTNLTFRDLVVFTNSFSATNRTMFTTNVWFLYNNVIHTNNFYYP